MTDDKKPREFWILRDLHGEIMRSVGIDETPHGEDFVMSVISYDAYAALAKENEELKEERNNFWMNYRVKHDVETKHLTESLKLAVEMIENLNFYSTCSACEENAQFKTEALATIKAKHGDL